MNERRLDFIHLLGLLGALLFVVCLYISPAMYMPWTAVFRPALLAALTMLAAVMLRRVVRGEKVRLGGPSGAAVVVLFTLLAISPLWALRPDETVAYAADTAKLALAFVGLATVLRTPGHVRLAMVVAAVASFIPTRGTLIRYDNGIDLVEGYRGAWIGLLANPNELAMVMAITLPWTLHAREKAGVLMRWVLLGAAGLQCAAAVVTHSRGGALGLGAAMITWAVLSQRRGRSMGLVALGAAAVMAFAPSSFWQRTGSIGDYEMDASARGRFAAWDTGFRALGDRPLLGVGGGNYVASWDRYTARNVRERALSAHNMWMQVMVELGLLGLAAFAAAVLLTARGLWKARNSAVGGEARALLGSIGALLICGQTGGYAFNWFLWLVLGLSAAVIAQHRLSRTKESGTHGDPIAAA